MLAAEAQRYVAGVIKIRLIMQRESSRLVSSNDAISSAPPTLSDSLTPRIGGILILIAIGLFLSLIQNLGHFTGSIAPLLRRAVWRRLTTPGSPAYHPYWKSVLLFEAVTSAVILLANAIAIVLFFRKERAFPKLIVIAIPIIFILIVIGHYISGLIPVISESEAYAREGRLLILRFVALHVWIPYFLLSKRVKKTFVR